MLENGNAALHMVYVCLQSNATDNANATFEKFEQYTLGTRATQSNSPYFT